MPQVRDDPVHQDWLLDGAPGHAGQEQGLPRGGRGQQEEMGGEAVRERGGAPGPGRVARALPPRQRVPRLPPVSASCLTPATLVVTGCNIVCDFQCTSICCISCFSTRTFC